MTQTIQTQKEQEYDIILRGHHLEIFIAFIGIKRKKVLRELEDTKREYLSLAYGGDHATKVIKIMDAIMTQSSAKIKLTDNLDDMCRECPKREPRCTEELREKDREEIESFNLRLNYTYSAKKLIRAIYRDIKQKMPEIINFNAFLLYGGKGWLQK